MRVQSVAESASVEDGVWQLALDLSGSEAGYLLISMPDDASTAAELFGTDHYIEVKDQAFGRYGGLASLNVKQATQLEIELSYDVAGVGSIISVATKAPLSGAILARLCPLERQ